MMAETRRVRIGNVGFTNAEPYRMAAPRFAADFINADPSVLSRLMARGEIDCALLPTGALPELGADVHALGPYGIACRGRVLSLRLFSDLPIARLVEEGRRITVTPRTTTTRRMLSELFLMEFGKRPVLSDEPGGDAVLLIGDEAMDLNRAEFRMPVSRDVSEWWYEQTGVPFVFAQWVITKDVTHEAATQLVEWVNENLALSETAAGRTRLIAAGERAGWSAAMAGLYFDRLEYRLDADHLAGLDRFLELLRRDG